MPSAREYVHLKEGDRFYPLEDESATWVKTNRVAPHTNYFYSACVETGRMRSFGPRALVVQLGEGARLPVPPIRFSAGVIALFWGMIAALCILVSQLH
jgi:hypothetical protein